EDAATVERYVAAFERFDIPAFTELLRHDAVLSMPPFSLWLQGPEAIAAWLATPRGGGCRGPPLAPTAARGPPRYRQERHAPGGGHTPWALLVLELKEGRIAGWSAFLDTATLFPRFGLPMALPAA